MPRTYLKVPFQQKDAAKALGAKWDATVSSRYVPEGVDTSAFSTWLSKGLGAITSIPALTESGALVPSTVTPSRRADMRGPMRSETQGLCRRPW